MNIIPELNLNKHPKDVKNNSLIEAKNVMVSNDNLILQNENRLNYETDNIFNSKIINQINKINIIYVLPCNREILFFNLQNDNTITIIRYNEILQESKIVLNELPYCNGKLLGTFTYNKENLIIVLSEYDADILVPLRTFNFGKWEDDIPQYIYKSSIVPKVKIPEISHDYILGNSYKGWYYVFIRYKINDFDYTQWYNTNYYYLIDNYAYNKVLNYHESAAIKHEIAEGGDNFFASNKVMNYLISTKVDITNISVKLEINDLDDNYDTYQVGFICLSKTYTKGFKTFDLNKSISTIIIDKLEEYNITELTSSIYNYYNVKTLTVVNNRLYIGNYEEKNTKISNYIPQVKGEWENTREPLIESEIILEPNYRFVYESIDILYPQSNMTGGVITGENFILNNGKLVKDIYPGDTILYMYKSDSDAEQGLNQIRVNIEVIAYNISENKYTGSYADIFNDNEGKYSIYNNNDKLQFVNKRGTWTAPIAQLVSDKTKEILLSASILPNEYYNFFINFVDEYGTISKPLKISEIQTGDYSSQKVPIQSPSVKIDDLYYIQTLKLQLTSELPNGWIGYFISYEKFESIVKYRGILYKDLINDKNNKICYFYSDALNYKDAITLSFNKVRLYAFDKKEDYEYSNTIEIINKTIDNKFIIKEYDILEKKLLVADSIGNELNSTRIQLTIDYDNGVILNEFSYCELIIDSSDNLYKNTNKTLIPCSKICYNIDEEIIVNTKNAFISNIGAIVINGYYFDTSVNVFKSYENGLINYYYSKQFIDIPNESISINNAPIVIAFPETLSDSAYKTKFKFGSVIEAKNTIDLFKLRQYASYEQYPKVLYYNETKHDSNFKQTIRRSNSMQDESNVNAWRVFNVLQYKNINENKGSITKLISAGKYFIAHTEHSMYLFNGTDTIKSDEGNIQLSSVDIMNLNYQEIITSALGYAGLQKEHHGIIGTFGYIFYSVDDERLYRYDNNKLELIDENITNFIKKNHFNDVILIDDKKRNRLLIKFINDAINTSVILSYNYILNAFISEHSMLLSQGYSTKNETYLINIDKDHILKYDSENYIPNSSIAVLINTDYELMKYLDVIKYKINEINPAIDNNKSPIEGRTKYYPADSLQIYSEFCDTGIINIDLNSLTDTTINTIENYKTPYWRFGNWHFNAIRDKLNDLTKTADEKSRVFGNWFVVKFNTYSKKVIEFETLDYKLSEDIN